MTNEYHTSNAATCYIALGSNLCNPLKQVCLAISAIKQLPGTQIKAVSPWYRSQAIGPGKQPDYINGVVAVTTELPPYELLRSLQRIENTQGRIREERWAARTLDLDILLYGELQISDPELQIPHPEMTRRNFVLYPLADVYTAKTLPGGQRLADLLANCPATGIVRLSAEENT